MNLFSALFDLVAGVFLTAKQAQDERDQQGPEGRAYDKWLAEHGYDGQYQAYYKEHGTHDGFVYKDPGDPPSFSKEPDQ